MILLAAFILFFAAGCGGDVFQTLQEPAATRENGGDGAPVSEYLCVSTTGNDVTGDGTEALPFATVNRAMEVAEETGADEIRVSVGDYEVGATFGIQLFDGLRLLGGYNPADWTRYPYQTKADRDAHTTTLSYTGSFSGLSGHPSRVIDSGDAEISSSTIIEGFTLKGKATGDYVSAIYCSEGASPVIRYNTIYGGGSSSVVTSYGIYTTALASPAITGNYISGGDGVVTQGIYSSYSSPDISDNTIYGGDASTNSSYAVRSVGDSSPVIRDNEIDGGNGYLYTYGIRNESSSPDIRGNSIYGGDSGTQHSNGIYNTGTSSSPKIYRNVIDGGTGKLTYGINNYMANAPLIYNNAIHGGAASTVRSFAVFNVGTGNNPLIYNNTIRLGTIADSSNAQSGSFGIFDNDNVTKPVIENNIIFAGNEAKSYGMYNASSTASPASFDNNDIFACETLYAIQQTLPTITKYTSIDDVNALAYADNNVSADPVFADQPGGDWRLTASTPSSVYDGGADLSAVFTADMDDVARTWWSMGAYEWVSP
ncbi:MAG: right-handed parallel beta-helix repeat-containing protein [Spirochaetes bacterium]|nr:right-handed parallel beta-helix repeat-containing protein [Spirochaetota bacterium]